MPDLIDPLSDYPTSRTFAGLSRPHPTSLRQIRRMILSPCSEEGFARIHAMAQAFLRDRHAD